MMAVEDCKDYKFRKYIKALNMHPHPLDNGFFVETIRSKEIVNAEGRSNKECNAYTVIYYLMTVGDNYCQSNPTIPFHKNKSDIVHYFHDGWPITYIVYNPTKENLQTIVLGPDMLGKSHSFHLKVPGGCWKAAILNIEVESSYPGEVPFALISEETAPGFEYGDHTALSKEENCDLFQKLSSAYPHLVSNQK